MNDAERMPMSDYSPYSPEELETMLAEMQRLATGIYPALVRIGCHPFIEFCGLMSEYVKVCRRAHAQGVQFPLATGHGEVALPVAAYELRYLAEKLHCIFSPMYRTDEARAIFAKALFGSGCDMASRRAVDPLP